MPDFPDDATRAFDSPSDDPTRVSPFGEDTLTRPTVAGGDATERIEPGALPAIPGYEVLRELGRGAMGVVYEARQHGLNRPVALKMVLAGTLAKTDDLVRFLSEAETAAKVRHQGIVQIYETGQHAGLPYYTMEFVDGGSLTDWLARQTITPTDSARIALALAEAVAAAHAVGVVHRDLKPGNILLAGDRGQKSGVGSQESGVRNQESEKTEAGSALTPDSRLLIPDSRLLTPELSPKIADFGLARRLEAGDGLTRAGTVMGTPSYMSPEQASGDTHGAGPAADIYSLGAILYEMLTGRPPFRSESPLQTLSLVLHAPPQKPRTLNRNVPRDLETIALKCLEKQPAKRYVSARALADDLRRFLDGRPILARRVGPVERLWRWANRNPAVALLVMAVFASLAVGTVISTILAIRADAQATRADENAGELAKKITEVESARKDAEKHAKDADIAHGEADKRAKEATDARRDLAMTLADSYVTLGQTAADQDRPQPALALLWFAQSLKQSAGDPDRVFANRVRVGSWSSTTIAPLGAFRRSDGYIDQLEFHPDGCHLLHGDIGRLQVTDSLTGNPWLAPEEFRGFQTAAWNRSGDRIILGQTTGTKSKVGVFEFPSGKPVRSWDVNERVTAVAFDSTGTKVAFGGMRARVCDLESGATVAEMVHTRWLFALEFAPDGKRIATGMLDASGYNGTVRVFPLAGEKNPKALFAVPHVRLQYHQPIPRFAANGTILLTYPQQSTIAALDPASGKLRFNIPTQSIAGDFALSPNGDTIWLGSRMTLSARDVSGKTATRSIPGHTTNIFSVAIGGPPDAYTVVTGCEDGTVRVVNGTGIPQPLPVLHHSTTITRVACSADGRRIATAQTDGFVRV
ncbi:MAG: serine/threonine-protein kinase [Planctomycetia bacterium]|nr:serine/threonine-protein kinase [Planctomycetia bacterium]